MEITSENFEAQFPLIEESLLKADFVSFDTEFSGNPRFIKYIYYLMVLFDILSCLGYSASLEDRGHEYDTVEERYQKMRFSCQKFIAFQFGLCTFHWDNKSKKYKCRPFSFYVFPKSQINDTSMLFQVCETPYLSLCVCPSFIGLSDILPDQEPLRLPEALRAGHRKSTSLDELFGY
jgi:hypothetical protein